MKNQKNIKQENSSQVNDLQSQLARALADYDNLRKRTDIEREVLLKFSSERIIARILPILDGIESAQMHLKDSGLAIIIADFKKLLYDERLEEIKCNKGEDFNEDLHEVIEISEGGKKGTISELILSGWKFIDGPVLRHAKVKVFGGKIERKN